MARLIKRGQIWVANLDPGYGIEIRHTSREYQEHFGLSPNAVLVGVELLPKKYNLIPL